MFLSERLNALGAQHWERFAGQNYFDRQGVFMSAVVSGPLLVAMFIVLVRECDGCGGSTPKRLVTVGGGVRGARGPRRTARWKEVVV